jgi:histidinol-phosphate phosphatase family protein
MGPQADRVPKLLLPFGGRPLFAHLVERLGQSGIDRVHVLGGHLSHLVARELPRLTTPGVTVELIVEPVRAGSGGCLRYLPPGDGPIVVLFGDVLAHMDFAALTHYHASKGGLATLAVHPNDHPHDSDLVEHDGDGRILSIHRKPHPSGRVARNVAAAGVFVVSEDLLTLLPAQQSADLCHDILAPLIEERRPVFAYRTTEYVKDVGTPDRFQESTRDFDCGLVHAMYRANRRPAAFLDRDGTVNRHVGLLSDPARLELLPGVASAIRRLNRAGVLVVVVTNQSVVARGICTETELGRIHARLDMMLGEHGAFVDAIYHCPHHPDAGYPGERKDLKRACICRKPSTGLIDRAFSELPIDAVGSFVVGDTERDAEMARRAGLPCYLIGGADGPGVTPVSGLAEAVERWYGSWSPPAATPDNCKYTRSII